MVNDVLDLSRIESGTVKLEYDTFDAVLVLGEIYETFLIKHSKENVDLVYESKFTTCNVTLDHNRFYQVVTNFLTNAIKYTPSGRVTLALDEVDGVVRVSVKDTGIGIAKDKHKLVFQRFEKLDSFAPGSGLGLSICKAIVEAMGGTIGFESEKDKGSTFWACFPYNVATSVTRNDNDMVEEQTEELTE
jgi:signal transduction histidine kinase